MKPSGDGEFPLSSSRDKVAVRRLLQAAKDFHAPVTVTLAEIEAAAQGQRRLGVGGTRFLLAAAVAAALLLVAGGVAVSRGWLGHAPRLLPTANVVTQPSPARPRVARRAAGPVGPEPVPAPPPEMAPPEAPVIAEPVRRPRGHRAGPPPAVVASSANASSPSPALAEVTQMRDALKKLRADRDPTAALPLLDDYDRRFPAGLLHDEVSAMRIEALMALDRTGDALEKVEALPNSLVARWPRLRIVRGELRANHGRCADAMADFAALLFRPSGDEIRGRAEAGRDACQAQRRKVDPAP
jgi:hypothetical protein